jgi:hypothetical protein
MASIPSVVSAAIKAVKSGLSANAGYRAFQAAGGAVARATWLRTVGEIRRTLSNQLDEATRPLNRRPTANEITPISTKTRSGYIQQVDVYVRNRDTGEVESRPFSWRTQVLVTRQAAVNEALAAFDTGVTGSPDRFNETVLGATYTSTLQLTPRGEF